LNFDLLQLPTASVLWGMASAVGAVLLALAALNRERATAPIRRGLSRLQPGVGVLRALHSGVIGDYVTWLIVGIAVLGGLFAVALR
jgi:multicomponent Na+:H+ antiporter subunit D